MSAPVYVIRVGQIRGEGDYYGLIDGAEGRAGAYRYMSWESAAEEIRDIPMLRDCRIVRVVRKPKDSIREGKAYGAGYRLGRLDGRLAALEEAERACSLVAEAKRQNFGTSSSSMDAARDCVDAIAAIRVSE